MNDSKRKEVLNEAIKCVCSDRDKQYGSPEDSFTEIAKLWSAYMGIDFTAHDVGMMLALMKVGRIKTGHHKLDNYIDAAGYIACAAECEEKIMSEVIWKHIPGYERYEVSSTGQVRSYANSGLMSTAKALRVSEDGDFYVIDHHRRIHLDLNAVYRSVFGREMKPCRGTSCISIEKCERCGHNPRVAKARSKRIRDGGLVNVGGLYTLVLGADGI